MIATVIFTSSVKIITMTARATKKKIKNKTSNSWLSHPLTSVIQKEKETFDKSTLLRKTGLAGIIAQLGIPWSYIKTDFKKIHSAAIKP